MKQVFKRDWEIVRIFLILAILTVGFVWGMQSLILTPTSTPALRSYGYQGASSLDVGPSGADAVLGQISLTEPLSRPASVLQSPLRLPADASPEK